MSYMKTNVRNAFIDAVYEVMGSATKTLTRPQTQRVVDAKGIKFPAWFTSPKYRTSERGVYDFESMVLETNGVNVPVSSMVKIDAPAPAPEPVATPIAAAVQEDVSMIAEMTTREHYVPDGDDTFVPFGYYTKMKKIIESGVFLPVFISGLSGNGKTFTSEQIAAEQTREFINVPITIETTEDDLLGGFRLINGETVWSNGPVVEAMQRGAILMLDEVDLASHKIMCLQSVIDGKGVYLKKINKYVKPEAGFQVIATANTKGKGKWKGQFVGTNVLNEAFLERFGVLFEQDYPPATVERKILAHNLRKYNGDPTDEESKNFIALLVEWSNQIRKQFDEGNITEVISTRRLVSIIKYYSIFGDKLDSVREGTNRFSEENKEAFTELYAGMDGDPELLNKLTDGDTSTQTDERVMVSL